MNIKSKTLNELRKELLECNNQPIKKAIIEKLIKTKTSESKTNISKEKKTEQNKNIVFNDSDSDYECDDSLNKLIELNTEQDNKYFQIPMDDKYKCEIEKDHANNKLLDRMNSELNFRIHGKQEKIFDKPYTNIDDNFAPVNTEYTEPKPLNKSVNKRMLGQRKIIK